MKFFNLKRYILYFICFYLIQITNENEQKQLERYKNSIYLILTRVNGIIDNLSLTFEYNKYNITFKDFKILKPFSPQIMIEKKAIKNETLLNISDIITTIEANVFIQLFIQKKEIISLKPIFFELIFDEIIFKLINNNEVQYFSSNIDMFSFKQLEKIFFFHDFNNEECLFYEGKKEPVVLVDVDFKLKEILKAKLEEKIIEKQKNFNMLTYDMIQIFDNSQFNSTYDLIYITALSVKKINLDEEDIYLHNNTISINYLSIVGKFRYSGYTDEYFNYNIQCRRNKEHFAFKYINTNNTAEIKFDLEDCFIDDDNEYFKSIDIEYHNEIKRIIQSYYVNYLKENADAYYNSLVE